MAFSIGFIITFFNNKFSIKILRNVFYFIITYSIDVFCIRIYFSCLLHHIKLFFVIKMSCHHSYKFIKFHLIFASIFKFYIINFDDSLLHTILKPFGNIGEIYLKIIIIYIHRNWLVKSINNRIHITLEEIHQNAES